MSAWAWRNQNPCTLLVGMQNTTLSMGNRRGCPPKIKNRTTMDPAISLLDTYPKEGKAES